MFIAFDYSFDEFRLNAMAAANALTRPTVLDCESARKLLSPFIIITQSKKADIHVTTSWNV